MNNTGKILTAFAAGATAGIILGILFAPDKGTETRRKMNDQCKQVAEELKEKFYKGKEKFGGLKDDMEQTIKEKVKDFA